MSKLFNNLEIRNYRAFDHLVIEELGEVNLFIGKNNIGKSSLLEALLLYANLGSPDIILEILTERDDLTSHQKISTKSPIAVSQSIWNLFNGYPAIDVIPEGIEIGAVNSPDSSLRMTIDWFGLGKTEKNGSILVPIDGGLNEYKGETVPALVLKQGTFNKIFRLDESLAKHAGRWHLQPKSILEFAIPSQCIGPHGIKKSAMSELWNNVALTPDLKNDIIESLQIIHPSINDVALLTTDSTAGYTVQVKMEGWDGAMPLKSLGDGMNRLFGLTLALVNSKDGLLLIDEIENGLHFSVMPFVWKFVLKVAKRLNVQVFATTHSMDCIKTFYHAAKKDRDIDGVATRIEYKKGEFRASQFNEERLTTIIEEDIEIR